MMAIAELKPKLVLDAFDTADDETVGSPAEAPRRVLPLRQCGGEPGRGDDANLATVAAVSAGKREMERVAAAQPGDDGRMDISGSALQRLLAWLSPSFPVGAYSYSHGLEWSIEDGSVTDAAALAAWLADILHHGAGRTDAILFAHAYRAAGDNDPAALAALVELAAAFQASKERRLEATAQGQAFLAMIAAAWPSPHLARLLGEIPTDPPVTYAIAVAVAAASHGVPLAPALTAYLAAFVANLVSAGVRAIPIGQTDGQRLIAATAPLIAAVAAAALTAGLDQLGGVTLRADIASMKHETQYTRLFRS